MQRKNEGNKIMEVPLLIILHDIIEKDVYSKENGLYSVYTIYALRALSFKDEQKVVTFL